MSDQAYPDALPPQYRMHWYTIERVLGQGGFGITYLARDTNLDQRVAIKEYLPVEVAARRADGAVQSRGDAQRERYRWGLERFIQEARTLARFDHPNIVRVHSVFEFNSTAYMVMRFEEGDNLGAVLERRGTLPEKDLLRILLPILDGLELVHNAGFIHRDIKPDNIHIRADGSPVLLDFGSARHALGKAHTLTILVAPGYAPFEQYHSSSENQGPWTDIYGLGATCYRAIAGTIPLDAISRSKGILGSTREVLVPVSTIGTGRYSGQLLAAVDHALAFAEKDRPQSISEWRKELAGDAPAARAASPVSSSAVGVATEKGAPSKLPSEAAAGPGAASTPAAAVTRGSWSLAPIAWAVAGAAAGAIAIAVFLRFQPADDGAEKTLAAVTQQIAQERESLEAQRKQMEEKQRQGEAERKALEEQRKTEEAKRRQEEQARLDEQRKQEEARRNQEQKARLAEQQRREAETRRQKEVQRAAKSPPPVVPQPTLPAEPAPIDTPAVVASVKRDVPRPSPQAEQLARGESALARGDYAVALENLKPLAAAGNTRAQIRLAEMYVAGQGVKRNNNQAYIWYSLAARSGNAAAAAERARLALLLQPAEIKQADKIVENWRAR